MPTYEYACTACGERTEARQSFTDPPLEECPHCGGRLRKLYSPVGIVFKGSGFYATDSKKKADSSSSSKGDSTSSGTKSESKPSGETKSSGESKSSSSSSEKSA
ncbi:MAG: FmdB family transcriptional regulator [Actinobacteria bacterium]|nr:FmdB family transcriptional regulator [Actinomycetota bacterium]